MGLRNLTFPTAIVQTSGGPLPVRGLSLDHVLGLFYRHRPEVTAFYDAVLGSSSKSDITPDDLTLIALRMIDLAPTLVAEVIALAGGTDARDPDFDNEVGLARYRLNLSEQLDALEKIAAQTFTSDMPPGKIAALVIQAMQAGASAGQNGLPA